ncbi:hypothetical protein JJB09_12405 [Rhizobium sp. KVB221]|uniref:5' DNA nuclease n=1 Tax=Rhizobium setariae TaxID=2801340 RepID=A0A937CMK3_9HYPH|nr:helix-hairpin-helix domain-containing protein [Rhizobium setariae]MBL0372831.1 hypothetical protein [Rhizobium setariae]
MTMMTAMGLNFTAQMAGALMGVTANSLDASADKSAAAKENDATAATVVPLRVVKKGRAVQADDLKRISGVGPKLEKMLKSMGVNSFAAIANWDDAEMRRIDEMLGLDNRVIRDNWAGQAKALLEG